MKRPGCGSYGRRGQGGAAAAEKNPGVPDQLILLSGSGDVSGLGPYPKLFVASEGEGLAKEVREMAEEAAGNKIRYSSSPVTPTRRQFFETDQGDNLTQDIRRAIAEVPVGGSVTPRRFLCATMNFSGAV